MSSPHLGGAMGQNELESLLPTL